MAGNEDAVSTEIPVAVSASDIDMAWEVLKDHHRLTPMMLSMMRSLSTAVKRSPSNKKKRWQQGDILNPVENIQRAQVQYLCSFSIVVTLGAIS